MVTKMSVSPEVGIWPFLSNIFNVVFVGSALATFVASVMSEEQQTRLRNGAFGVVAGSSVGALAGLFNNKPDLLAVGFLGSTVGGVAGWIVHILLSALAGTRRMRPLLEYQFGGFSSVRNRLQLDEQNLLLSALRDWRDNYTRMLGKQREAIIGLDPSQKQSVAKLFIESWLVSFVDTYGLVFGAIAEKRQYRSRVTVILFGEEPDGKRIGKHWISYSGSLEGHKTSVPFPENSIGYKVLIEELPSPYFTDSMTASVGGHSRSEKEDRPFCTFRVNSDAIVALDWPHSMKEDDPYVQLAKDTFHTDVCPTICEVLSAWSIPPQGELGLKPLRTSPRATVTGEIT
jgi:hypothetical protein